jgi:hypothetical protein
MRPSTAAATPRPADDLADSIELLPAPEPSPGSTLPALVRWLRAVRDRQRAGAAARKEGAA